MKSMNKLNKEIIRRDNLNTFANVTKKVNDFKEKDKSAKLISLGVGDVSKPIIKVVVDAMHKAVDELSDMKTFKGYGYYFGHDFLKEKILLHEYEKFNFSLEEIYISNGSKSDVTNILELFDSSCKILVTDPMYPVYELGAKVFGKKVYKIDLSDLDNFIPKIPKEKYDLIYFCSPNNPLGIAYDYNTLKQWVDYAIENDSVILYDNVYHSFIRNSNIPKSIYEIENAKKVAIEFRSFSKRASFTGVRCSYYVIPNEIEININKIWKERTINRFNGAGYIAQRGAEATYSIEATEVLKNNINDYLNNAKNLKETFVKYGFKVWGGDDSPFLWVKTKDNLSSWEIFYIYLEKMNIIIIPGIIFGSIGDGYFRVSALGETSIIKEAIERIEEYYGKET